jgi:hypothetical protein
MRRNGVGSMAGDMARRGPAQLALEREEPMKFTVRFEHAAGGSELLPKADYEFFDDYEIEVDAADGFEAEVKAITAMHDMVKAEHPHWLEEVVCGLCPEIIEIDGAPA